MDDWDASLLKAICEVVCENAIKVVWAEAIINNRHTQRAPCSGWLDRHGRVAPDSFVCKIRRIYPVLNKPFENLQFIWSIMEYYAVCGLATIHWRIE